MSSQSFTVMHGAQDAPGVQGAGSTTASPSMAAVGALWLALIIFVELYLHSMLSALANRVPGEGVARKRTTRCRQRRYDVNYGR